MRFSIPSILGFALVIVPSVIVFATPLPGSGGISRLASPPPLSDHSTSNTLRKRTAEDIFDDVRDQLRQLNQLWEAPPSQRNAEEIHLRTLQALLRYEDWFAATPPPEDDEEWEDYIENQEGVRRSYTKTFIRWLGDYNGKRLQKIIQSQAVQPLLRLFESDQYLYNKVNHGVVWLAAEFIQAIPIPLKVTERMTQNQKAMVRMAQKLNQIALATLRDGFCYSPRLPSAREDEEPVSEETEAFIAFINQKAAERQLTCGR